ncbi:hypothetical protein PInf_013501 [Phytophthora infestans]|nr:hypothetical protein PInf_013501 [Phytophthora infestans]
MRLTVEIGNYGNNIGRHTKFDVDKPSFAGGVSSAMSTPNGRIIHLASAGLNAESDSNVATRKSSIPETRLHAQKLAPPSQRTQRIGTLGIKPYDDPAMVNTGLKTLDDENSSNGVIQRDVDAAYH